MGTQWCKRWGCRAQKVLIAENPENSGTDASTPLFSLCHEWDCRITSDFVIYYKYLLCNWKRAQLAAAFFLIKSAMCHHFWVVSMHYLILCSYSNIWNNGRNSQGITRGARGHNSPGAESLGDPKAPTMSKYFLQYSTFASEIPQVRTQGRQTCLLPRAPSNLVTSLVIAQSIWNEW